MPRFDKLTREEELAIYEKEYCHRLASEGKLDLTQKMIEELDKNAETFDDYEKDYLARLEAGVGKSKKVWGAMPKGWKPEETKTEVVNLEETVSKIDDETNSLKKELSDLTDELESEKKNLNTKSKKKPNVKKTKKKQSVKKSKKKPKVKKTKKKQSVKKSKKKPKVKKTKKK